MPLLAARLPAPPLAQTPGPQVRLGFCSPSLEGGLPLLPLFSPSLRSSSATRAERIAICACCPAITASNSSVDAGRTGNLILTLTHAAS
jgi:hypothetical protein